MEHQNMPDGNNSISTYFDILDVYKKRVRKYRRENKKTIWKAMTSERRRMIWISVLLLLINVLVLIMNLRFLCNLFLSIFENKHSDITEDKTISITVSAILYLISIIVIIIIYFCLRKNGFRGNPGMDIYEDEKKIILRSILKENGITTANQIAAFVYVTDSKKNIEYQPASIFSNILLPVVLSGLSGLLIKNSFDINILLDVVLALTLFWTFYKLFLVGAGMIHDLIHGLEIGFRENLLEILTFEERNEGSLL